MHDPNSFQSANFGDVIVKAEDVVFADADGVVFAPVMQIEELLSTAKAMYHTERSQADAIRSGKRLREQRALLKNNGRHKYLNTR